MKKLIKLLTMLGAFAAVAALVYVAGETALSGSPLMALVPVTIILTLTILYIRLSDKRE
ncbi:hypothetical protein RCH20_000274 [Psychrobacter sp. PL15]|jgi:hypothetical protein|uniref:hypothetical protein n=1 Tax=unclassified Psychrobacter TaxID=196806 RepID=UPI001AEB6702|nr:hypothetical protein [Psychrobacter sp. PL15]MEC5209232.1 hypothetical protein [Psychrobacter sp. PL15]